MVVLLWQHMDLMFFFTTSSTTSSSQNVAHEERVHIRLKNWFEKEGNIQSLTYIRQDASPCCMHSTFIFVIYKHFASIVSFFSVAKFSHFHILFRFSWQLPFLAVPYLWFIRLKRKRGNFLPLSICYSTRMEQGLWVSSDRQTEMHYFHIFHASFSQPPDKVSSQFSNIQATGFPVSASALPLQPCTSAVLIQHPPAGPDNLQSYDRLYFGNLVLVWLKFRVKLWDMMWFKSPYHILKNIWPVIFLVLLEETLPMCF